MPENPGRLVGPHLLDQDLERVAVRIDDPDDAYRHVAYPNIFAAGLAVILVVMGASPPPARAAMTTLYVDNNAPLCKPTAYPTIQAAVDATTGPARIIVWIGARPSICAIR